MSLGPMIVTVNGRDMELAEGTAVDKFLAELGVRLQGAAVEVNRCIVPRAEHGRTVLRDGDKVEIVTLVGGG